MRYFCFNYNSTTISPSTCFIGTTLLEPIHQDKKQQPDYVHEVPVPRYGFKTKMLFGRKVACHAAEQNHNEHDRSDRDMESMETREHIKRCAEHTLLESEALVISVHVFVDLKAQEKNAQRDR